MRLLCWCAGREDRARSPSWFSWWSRVADHGRRYLQADLWAQRELQLANSGLVCALLLSGVVCLGGFSSTKCARLVPSSVSRWLMLRRSDPRLVASTGFVSISGA